MMNKIQLQPHSTSTIPLHVESPISRSARTAIEIIAPQSPITDSILTTLSRNDETGQILIPTTPLSNLIHKKFILLETLEPHSLRDYVLTFQPIASLQPELQRQTTPFEMKYGIEEIDFPSSQNINTTSSLNPSHNPTPPPSSPSNLKTLQSTAFTKPPQEIPTTSPTPTPEHHPQVLGVTTTNASSQSALHFNTPPKLPPIFFLLLFTGIAVSIYAIVKNMRFAARERQSDHESTQLTEHPP